MKKHRNIIYLSMAMTILLTLLSFPAMTMAAEATVNLGTAASYAVLAGTTITNTGPTRIGGSVGGNIGVSPGSSVTGFPPGEVADGTIHMADAAALQAQSDLTIAYNDAASRPVTQDLTGQDLGGMTLTTGVYSFSSSAQLTGTLTLDAAGDPEAVFIFQIGSTLTTASGSTVNLINGAPLLQSFLASRKFCNIGNQHDVCRPHIRADIDCCANRRDSPGTIAGQKWRSDSGQQYDYQRRL